MDIPSSVSNFDDPKTSLGLKSADHMEWVIANAEERKSLSDNISGFGMVILQTMLPWYRSK